MFGKFMNNYYYGKSGKGDYTPEDLPKTRWQLFWEMLRVRFNGLCRMNLIYMLPWLPTMLVIGMMVLYVLKRTRSISQKSCHRVLGRSSGV